MREIDHLNKIRAIIDRGFHIDGVSVRAKDMISNLSQNTIRTTLALVIGYIDGIDATNEVEIEVNEPAPTALGM